jgi:hypothetical protein
VLEVTSAFPLAHPGLRCNKKELAGISDSWNASFPGAGTIGPAISLGKCAGVGSRLTSTLNLSLSIGGGLYWQRCRITIH